MTRSLSGPLWQQRKTRAACARRSPSSFLWTGYQRVTAEGHFGNEIKILEAVLRKREAAAFFQILREQLPAEDLAKLRREIPDRLEGDSHFHLRLDKQAAYKGLLRLTDSKDALDTTILVKTYPARRESALKIISELI